MISRRQLTTVAMEETLRPVLMMNWLRFLNHSGMKEAELSDQNGVSFQSPIGGMAR